ncbi:unnamed protein product [Albugo candida]|uniref:Uncharacterized protein n=1 Tax=Albugo candida TaxID=65357 RepID=A0A024GS53_9STRA|nr:unnamed protein product [Albugo candida]|eukprot:CCI49381.1 unnamed protein product [Albugo candida]
MSLVGKTFASALDHIHIQYMQISYPRVLANRDNWSFHRINEWLKESCISLFGNPVTCFIADFATIFASAPNNVLHNAKALDSTRSVAASQTYPHHLKNPTSCIVCL